MIEEVTIRPTVPKDAELLIAHWIAIASEADVYVSYTASEANAPVEKQSESIARDMELSLFNVVGEADGRIVAHITCSTHPYFSITRHTAQLGMSVDRAFRNRGLGSRLIERAVRWAEERGVVRLELEVYADNAPAVHLYEKFGFQIEGRKRMYAYQNGRYYDGLVMARLFV